ncbi:MAG TPA: N,N-dimethylformamidase beta subunit family domain-containing protein [Bryobacteraceae bacterium]|nr:N,N-dimethylformamidase beta subunit family domain-containing protein [Bryobacteraceae bacterium]
MNRRSILKAGMVSSLAALPGAAQVRRDNRIVAENSKPGTPEWQLQFTRFDNPLTLASYPLNRDIRSSAIEGYASKTSVLPGETIDFMVGMQPAGAFRIDFYRMGYYGGTGGRHMLTLGPFKAEPQPVPMMTIERLRECAWPKSASLTVPKDWPSGVYLGKLTRDQPFGAQSYVVFVVKEHRPCDLLFQVADLTWQAYNKWPGKDSMYDDGTPEVWYTGPNVRVSFNRPYGKYCQVIDAPLSAGSGSFLLWEHPLAFWLEQHGYDVSYCSNLDLHLDPGILKTAKVFLSIGHDEYWSRKMFEEAVKARDEGLSIAFLSGNAVDGEIILYESSVTGAPCRSFARRAKFPDEETLMGSSSYGSGYGDWIVTKPDHWIYEGTNLKAGDKIRGVIGWEYHGLPLAKIPGLEVVAAAPLYPSESKTGRPKEHAAVVYRCPKGNWVFNAGTIWWSEHLSFPPGHIPARTFAGGFGVNPLIQRITTNVLNRMLKDSPIRS